jgi:uncharacterized integral membrane protein
MMVGAQPDEENVGPDGENGVDGALPEPPILPVEQPEPIASTRASRAWVRVLPALIVLAILLVFVFQNRKDVKISFFGWSGMLPLAVALLASAALGMLVLLALGSVRMLQLRRQVRRKKKAAHDRA